MRKVIDSNYLGTKDLRDYLAASRENKVVVTDYAEMEMFKADTLKDCLNQPKSSLNIQSKPFLRKQRTLQLTCGERERVSRSAS
jgi:hypothetical protein